MVYEKQIIVILKKKQKRSKRRIRTFHEEKDDKILNGLDK